MADPTPATPAAPSLEDQVNQLTKIMSQVLQHLGSQQLGTYGNLGAFGSQQALGQSGALGLLQALGLGGLNQHTGTLVDPVAMQRNLYPQIPQGQYIQMLGGSLQKPTAQNYLGPLTILNNLLTGLRDKQAQQQPQQDQGVGGGP